MFPLGGGNPPPAPKGWSSRRVGYLVMVAERAKVSKFLAIVVGILLHIFFGGVFGPPLGPLQEASAFRRIGPSESPEPTFFRSKFLSFFDIDFWSILGRFGTPSWGHFWHFWRPRWTKFGPKRILEAYPHQKREFSPNTTPADTAAIFGAPRCLPKCPKIGPRRLQEALGEHFFRS